jgi:hypothetical protein
MVRGFSSALSLTSLHLSHNYLAPQDPLIWPLEDWYALVDARRPDLYFQSISTLTELTTLCMRNSGLAANHCLALARLLTPLSVTNLDLANNQLVLLTTRQFIALSN